jgi:hypothetical protein
VFAYNIEKEGRDDLQFEIIYLLIYAFRTRHYYYDRLKSDRIHLLDYFDLVDVTTSIQRIKDDYWDMIEKYAMEFVTDHSCEIRDIMCWQERIEFFED